MLAHQRKRFMAGLLAAVLLFGMLPAAAMARGSRAQGPGIYATIYHLDEDAQILEYEDAYLVTGDTQLYPGDVEGYQKQFDGLVFDHSNVPQDGLDAAGSSRRHPVRVELSYKAEEQQLPKPERDCPVDYQQQSETVSWRWEDHTEQDGYFLLNYTIQPDAQGTQVIDLSKAIQAMNEYAADFGYDSYPLQPGDENLFRVVIENQSGHQYQYQPGSFVMATADTRDFPNETDVLGFDGQLLPFRFIGALAKSAPMLELYGVSGSSKVTIDRVLGLYGALEQRGYTGPEALTDYILDYYNAKKGESWTSIQEMLLDDPSCVVNMQGNLANHQYTISREKLQEIENSPMMDHAMVREKDDGSVEVQFKWPEPQLAAASYALFYRDLLCFLFSDSQEELDGFRGNGSALSRAHGVGDYLEDKALYQQADQYFNKTQDESLKPQGSLEYAFKMALDGPWTNNSYQLYDLSWYNVIALEQLDTTYTVKHEYYTSTNGGEYALDGVWTQEAASGMVGDVIPVSGIAPAPSYNGHDYRLASADPDQQLTLVWDAQQNVITLKYHRSVNTTTTYTVKHEYYTSANGGAYVLDGTLTEQAVRGAIGKEILVSGIAAVPSYNGNDYQFVSADPADQLVLVRDEAQNVITLKYQRSITTETVYTVRHEYYTATDGGAFALDGVFEQGPVGGGVGQVVAVSDLTKLTDYQDHTYGYAGAQPGEQLVLAADGSQNVIVLRYERTVTTPDPDNGGDDDDDTPPKPVVPDETTPDEVIPDEQTPLNPGPDTSIPDEEIPAGPGPEQVEGIEIVDPDTPLGNLPQTGTVAQPVNPGVTLGLMALAASLAAAGIAAALGRKKDEE